MKRIEVHTCNRGSTFMVLVKEDDVVLTRVSGQVVRTDCNATATAIRHQLEHLIVNNVRCLGSLYDVTPDRVERVHA